MSEQLTCRQRWANHKDGRVRDIRKLWGLYQQDPEASDEELGRMDEYGLCFDYVAPGTFRDQHTGYWRYQLGYGGPSDEFRFYADGPETEPYRITYSFLDWWDGYERKLMGQDEALLLEIWRDFQEMGSVQAQYDAAQ